MNYYFEKWKTRSILPFHTTIQPSHDSILSNPNQNYRQSHHLEPYNSYNNYDHYDPNYNYYNNNTNYSNDKRKGILYNQDDEEEESNNINRKKKVRKTIISMLETMKWYSNRLENERLKNQQLKMELRDEKAINNLPIPQDAYIKSIQSPSSIHYNEISSPLPQHHQQQQQQHQDFHRPIMYHQQQQPLLNRNWIPIFSYLLSIGFCILFVYEMIIYKQNYGIILSLSPFNMMLGPNSEIMVKSGALFTSCIRKGNLFNDTTSFNCGSNTPPPLTPPSWFYFVQPSTSGTCHLQNLCGLTKFSNDGFPDQHYRFLTTTLVHSGLVQLIINIIVLLTFCSKIEKKMNPLRYAFCWVVSGIFGSMFVSLFLNDNTVLTGCFGSIFGVVGLSLVDLFKSWQGPLSSNGQSLFEHILLIVGGAILGYFPGYNNFNHLGGLLAGILIGVMVLPTNTHLKSNKKKWIMVMLIRLVSFIILTVAFYLIISSFYSNRNLSDSCSFCHYVSCLPFSTSCSMH